MYSLYNRHWIPHFLRHSIQRWRLLYMWVNIIWRFMLYHRNKAHPSNPFLSWHSQHWIQLHQNRKSLNFWTPSHVPTTKKLTSWFCVCFQDPVTNALSYTFANCAATVSKFDLLQMFFYCWVYNFSLHYWIDVNQGLFPLLCHPHCTQHLYRHFPQPRAWVMWKWLFFFYFVSSN